jgi:hypothetical protein
MRIHQWVERENGCVLQGAADPHVAEYERGNLQRNSLREEERNRAGFQQPKRGS